MVLVFVAVAEMKRTKTNLDENEQRVLIIKYEEGRLSR